jgi:hypothetical protein
MHHKILSGLVFPGITFTSIAIVCRNITNKDFRASVDKLYHKEIKSYESFYAEAGARK